MADLGTSSFSIVDHICLCQSINDVEDIFISSISRIGFVYCASYMVTGPRVDGKNPFHFANWPAGWFDEYNFGHYHSVDAITRYALLSGAPATWAEVYSLIGHNDPARRVQSAAAATGLNDGIVMPLRNAAGDLGLVTIGGERAPLHVDEMEYLKIISAAAFRTCETFVADLCVQKSIHPFTRREMDCINLLKQGLTDAEIARAFGLSRATVATHVENARRKVNARSRTHLVSLVVQGCGTKGAS